MASGALKRDVAMARVWSATGMDAVSPNAATTGADIRSWAGLTTTAAAVSLMLFAEVITAASPTTATCLPFITVQRIMAGLIIPGPRPLRTVGAGAARLGMAPMATTSLPRLWTQNCTGG